MPLVCRYINIIKNLMGLNRFEICFVGFLKADTFLENQAENLHSNLKKQSIFVRRNGCQLVAHCNLRLFKKKKKNSWSGLVLERVCAPDSFRMFGS